MPDSWKNVEALKAWLSLLSASNAVKRELDTRLRAHFDLSISRFDVLSALDRSARNGLRAGELSRQLFVTEGNTTQVMSKLVKEGLVLRRADASDGRAVNYSLSDEGKRLFDEAAGAHGEWVRAVFDGLSKEQFAGLHQTLASVKSDLKSNS